MVIFRIINSVVKEEIFNPIFCKQRAAKDSQDLHDRAIEFEFMFNDSDKTVGNDGHMDLDADGILRFSPKGLDLEMLLNPFEEEFNLLSVAIQECDILGREVEVIGVVGKGSLQFRSIVDDSSEFRRIVCSVVFPNEADCLIADNIVLSFKEVFSRDYDINSFIMVTVGDAGDTIRQLRFRHRNGKIRGCEGDGCCNTRTYDDQSHLHYVNDSKTGFSSIYTYIGDTLIEKKLFFHDTLQSVHTAIINGHKYPVRTIGKTDIHYSYEYDDYGSWTRKTSTSNDGKIGEILRRIDYY